MPGGVPFGARAFPLEPPGSRTVWQGRGKMFAMPGEDEASAQADALWAAEIDRRARDVAQGKVELINSDAVHAQIAARLRDRDALVNLRSPLIGQVATRTFKESFPDFQHLAREVTVLKDINLNTIRAPKPLRSTSTGN